ncbi:MAG: acetate--CoA ligase family protein [Thaumarchaeota archaeon]|nr:acetate--CoA ligase family protein [Nitrososphaerota archaeon]
MAKNASRGLQSFFAPASIAVAGVSPDPDKLGSIIFTNLRESASAGTLRAAVYPVNPKHDQLWGERSFPSIKSLPEVPELLVVAVPAASALDLVKEAANAGVKAAILIPGGFAEVGNRSRQAEIKDLAGRKGMRILGPNTIGLIDMKTGVDTLFLKTTKTTGDGRKIISSRKPLKGSVVVITQSGHLGETVSEELAARGVGVRALVGTGNQLDVSVEEVVEHFAEDEGTSVIAIYLEGLVDGRRFMRAASKAAKPVVALKAGRTGAGGRATLTHTASLAGDYAAYQAAFRQCGAIEARDLQELIDSCVMFSSPSRVTGNRLAVITNAGGVGTIAAEVAEESGLDVDPPGRGSARSLKSAFRGSGFISNASLSNPFDLTATASTEEFVRLTEATLLLPDYDMALVLPTHQTPAIAADIASRLADVMEGKKPAVASVIGWSDLADSIRAEFAARRIPSFPTPERAARALSLAAAWGLRNRSAPVASLSVRDRFASLARHRGTLSAPGTERLLASYGIPSPESRVVTSETNLRPRVPPTFPLACKLLSRDLVHKTEAGGVILDVRDEKTLRSAFLTLRGIARRRRLRFDGVMVQKMVEGIEVIIGGTRDPTFGPTVLVGTGGRLAEVIRDYSVSIAPVNSKEATDMIKRTKLAKVLEGYRGGTKVDVGALARTVAKFSKAMFENPSIAEMEVNPLVASGRSFLAVDARVVIARPGSARIADSSVPRE